jgi:hypothetical protein
VVLCGVKSVGLYWRNSCFEILKILQIWCFGQNMAASSVVLLSGRYLSWLQLAGICHGDIWPVSVMDTAGRYLSW